jgi:hypothetical protein
MVRSTIPQQALQQLYRFAQSLTQPRLLLLQCMRQRSTTAPLYIPSWRTAVRWKQTCMS